VRRLGAALLLSATPLLVAATSDRQGDVVSCTSGAQIGDTVPDVVSVEGVAAELGTAAVWRVTFASAIPVPDRDGAPLRIDVLVRDPRLPPVTLADEHGMNRIVRWDDIAADNPIDIVWLRGRGHTPFNPPVVDRRTVEITVPGRILLGEAENGTESVGRARWSVLVRDGDACDRVGNLPVFRLEPLAEASASPLGAPTEHPTDAPIGATRSWVGSIVLVAAILAVVIFAVSAVLRRRSF
jgi:hypothetical protein